MIDAIIECALALAAFLLLLALARENERRALAEWRLEYERKAGRELARLLEGRQQDHRAEVRNLNRYIAKLQLDKAELLERCGETP